MSESRSNFDRGPPEGRLSDRFSTTYSSSYRPLAETLRNVALRCGTDPKPITPFVNGGVSTTPPRGSRVRSSDLSPYVDSDNAARGTNPQSVQPFPSRALTAIDRSDSVVGVRRPWDDLVSNRFDPQRLKPCGLSVTGTASDRVASNTHDISSGITGSSLFSLGSAVKNYTSTYTTTVAPDKSDPSFSAARDPICDKVVQTINPSSPGLSSQSQRTLNSVTPSFSGVPKADNQSELPISKKTTSPRESGLSINSAVSSQPATIPFDYGQMFSQIARINSHLYLSSLSALTPDRLRQHGITLLVSAMVDSPPLQLRNAVSSSLHVPVEDMEGANLRVHFGRVGDRIAAEHRRGGRALVHCMAGVSRSSTLVLAYLVRHMNMSLADAYQHVRSVRPCIQPNPSFWRQLLDYEERVRGSRSVRLLTALDFVSSCSITPASRLLSNGRAVPRTTYLDLYSRHTGDLLPYRPLTSLISIDSGKPYVGCKQPLG